MGNKIHIPGLPQGVEFQEPSQDTQLLLQGLGQLNRTLGAVERLLDLLVRLECGVQKRPDLAKRIREFDAAQEAEANARQAALQEEGA
jgi:hypothetical protein